MSYSKVCHNIKDRMNWDKILISPVPRSRVLHEGYRINITSKKEDDIEQAKKILKEAGIIFEDRYATSYSETVEPGDRTLRVVHQKSVMNLRKMWMAELEKFRLAHTLKGKERK